MSGNKYSGFSNQHVPKVNPPLPGQAPSGVSPHGPAEESNGDGSLQYHHLNQAGAFPTGVQTDSKPASSKKKVLVLWNLLFFALAAAVVATGYAIAWHNQAQSALSSAESSQADLETAAETIASLERENAALVSQIDAGKEEINVLANRLAKREDNSGQTNTASGQQELLQANSALTLCLSKQDALLAKLVSDQTAVASASELQEVDRVCDEAVAAQNNMGSGG